MRLFEEFKKQIEELGQLKYVWLTAFTVDIEFVEGYLLSAVLGLEPPRNRLDFEGLQQELINTKIDFQLFVDQRMLIQAGDRKRTSVGVTGVSPRQIPYFSEESLFHAKVIYLEAKDGRAVLGTGSANLTIDGWGRNQEVFAFRKLCTDDQVQQVREFFKPLFSSSSNKKLPNIARKRWGNDKSWQFVHSFQDTLFLQTLRPGSGPLKEIAIWSPYFPHDLASFLAVLRKRLESPKLEFHIVPDLIEGHRIRAQWTKPLERELKQEGVRFYKGGLPMQEEVTLRHAKIWMTVSRLAIGSWNCTNPGANALMDDNGYWREDKNIEAGFVFTGKFDISKSLGEPLAVSREQFASKEELDEDALDVPDLLPFEIQVGFDWKQQEYQISGEWVGAMQRGFSLVLPDRPEIVITPPNKGTDLGIPCVPVAEPTELLSSHYFRVLLNGRTVSQGVIAESGLEHRRGECYQSLDDLLDSHIPENDTRGGTTRIVRGGEPDENDDSEPKMAQRDVISSYFKLFHALSSYGEVLKQCKDADSLEQRVFAWPGGVKEIQEKARQVREQQPRSVYVWFLIQELNVLIRTARSLYKKLGGKLKGAKWDALQPEPLPKLDFQAQPKLIKLIRKEAGYE